MINLLEDAYPESFIPTEFDSIRSFKGKINYAKTHLKRLGAGSSRIVYKIDDEKVLKLAKNKRGVLQNGIEIDFRNQSPLFAEVFDFHPYSLWVEMEYAKKMTTNKFKELTGYYLEEMDIIINYNYYQKEKKGSNRTFFGGDIVHDMLDNEYIHEIYDLISNQDFLSGDFLRLSSWGVVERNGKEVPVLVDFGYHESILYDYFAV